MCNHSSIRGKWYIFNSLFFEYIYYLIHLIINYDSILNSDYRLVFIVYIKY